MIYDQHNNFTFSDKIESMKCDAALAIIGAIRGILKEKLYQLCIKFLKERRLRRRLCYLHKIISPKLPS